NFTHLTLAAYEEQKRRAGRRFRSRSSGRFRANGLQKKGVFAEFRAPTNFFLQSTDTALAEDALVLDSRFLLIAFAGFSACECSCYATLAVAEELNDFF